MPTLVIIAAQSDTPVYTHTFPASAAAAAAAGSPAPPPPTTLELLLLNAALDAVDEAAWATRDSYLRTVDTFADAAVAAYITAAGVRLLAATGGGGAVAGEEGVRAFFVDVHELWARVALNPLYVDGEPVRSRVFRERVAAAAARRWP
ncbi:hypothetical protein MMPV_004985 [Pyropia vietnamensis]